MDDDRRVASLVSIAHGAANIPARAARAARLGADVIEADVHSYRGAIEVRHLKTLGRLPLLWDRWKLAPGWGPRLHLADLAAQLAAAPGPALMLDLKGSDLRLPASVLDAIQHLREVRRILVCSQNWRQVDQLLDVPGIDVLHSIGSQEQLGGFAAWPACGMGISIHRRLLSQDVVDSLKLRAPFIITWPINDEVALQQAVSYGLHGVTTDNDRIIDRISAARRRLLATTPAGDGSATT